MLLPMSHGGYRVREVTSEDLRNLYQCRAVLEGLAAQQAAVNLSASQIRNLGSLIVAAEAKIKGYDFDEALKLNTKFHDVIIQSSGNEHLARLADVITKMILLNRLNLLKFSRSEERREGKECGN